VPNNRVSRLDTVLYIIGDNEDVALGQDYLLALLYLDQFYPLGAALTQQGAELRPVQFSYSRADIVPVLRKARRVPHLHGSPLATTSCGSGNSLFTGGGVEDILLGTLPAGSGASSLSFPFPRLLFIPLDIQAASQQLVVSPVGTRPGQRANSWLIGPMLYARSWV
jgi:hypothetical protein